MVPPSYLQVGSQIQLRSGKIASLGLYSRYSPASTVTITVSATAMGPLLSVSGPLFMGSCESCRIDIIRLVCYIPLNNRLSYIHIHTYIHTLTCIKISGTLVNGGYFLANASIVVASEQASSQSLLSIQRFLDQVGALAFMFSYNRVE